MRIRTRLTILFTLITATILFVFAGIIYISAQEDREEAFYTSLRKEAVTKANLFFNTDVEEQVLKDIYQTNSKILNEAEVAIYDTTFNLLYHDAENIDFVKETPEMISHVLQDNELRFYTGKRQAIGLRYDFRGKIYILTATAVDWDGYHKLTRLLQNSAIVFVISILFIYLAGYFFSKKAFEPVKEMTEKARVISATSLDLRLKSNGNKDELTELANTFNEMLVRLESSFESQKHFVSNISHELRTPLSAIITELELSGNKDRSVHEYKLAIQNVLSDTKKLVRLLNSLLDLAKASYDPSEIAFKELRIDELLLDALQHVHLSNPEYKMDIHFENHFETDREVSVNGNEYLLKAAFYNLFENGCKFSGDRKCTVEISFEPEMIHLRFIDHGIGISPKDISHIFTPFFRGENRKFAEGNGIGLSLTQRIIHLHGGTISVASSVGQGSAFTIRLKNLSPL